MTITDFVDTMNAWGQQKVPFLFVIDFEMEKPFIARLSDLQGSAIWFDINGYTNTSNIEVGDEPVEPLHVIPHDRDEYARKFAHVFERLGYGDSFLTNLTVKTRVTSANSLQTLFHASRARYKLLFQNEFLVFSPEIFVQIRDGKIYSYPMKGTIDAAVPNAAQRILGDEKERAEHTTIVDLIRNDLSQVATRVTVSRFRYLEEIRTNHKNLLQVSSEIVGELPDDYGTRLGSILVALLPAGSVSGAPKVKTVEIIRQAEGETRGYYTGIFGYFNGQQLDSGVMIRFLENQNGAYYYRSGGGITTQSQVDAEYQETIDKVYVPLT
ncbi:aminodeoxychorismate synthase component I [Dawidia soli]|uniref:Aminodeoxychorismate synthase component I n=1 Tax=Dawidia soli TaxID=2782352 RepID=A0AAP2GL08_9BACT|nr:aminodeoxychorismate synthase component I [Dawidia soli]MBT1689618.1 aminodeoxychorismate synthase component I [Dawidia soli]